MKTSVFKKMVGAAMVAVVGFVAVGCGGDDEPDDDGGKGGWGSCSFTNPSNGQPYRTAVMPDGKTWMAENLNCATADSWCYNNNSSNCNTYGRLYAWNAARTACPSGWRLPTSDDWGTLVQAAGGYNAGTQLKATSGWYDGDQFYIPGTDVHGFSALPGGNRSTDGSFWNVGGSGGWWTATEGGSDYAYYRYMGYNYSGVDEGLRYKSNGFSVRCLRN